MATSSDGLENDVLLYILGFLPLQDLGACARVCKRWRTLASAPSLWRKVHVPCHLVGQALGCIGARVRHLSIVRASDNALEMASTCATELISLDVAGSRLITDNGLRALVTIAHTLEGLVLTGCPNVTDVPLPPIAPGFVGSTLAAVGSRGKASQI
jgi:hypothetical protein